MSMQFFPWWQPLFNSWCKSKNVGDYKCKTNPQIHFPPPLFFPLHVVGFSFEQLLPCFRQCSLLSHVCHLSLCSSVPGDMALPSSRQPQGGPHSEVPGNGQHVVQHGGGWQRHPSDDRTHACVRFTLTVSPRGRSFWKTSVFVCSRRPDAKNSRFQQ